MSVRRDALEEDNLAKFETWGKGFKRLLHGLDGHLSNMLAMKPDEIIVGIYQGSSPRNVSSSRTGTSKSDTSETPVSNFFQQLKFLFETHG